MSNNKITALMFSKSSYMKKVATKIFDHVNLINLGSKWPSFRMLNIVSFIKDMPWKDFICYFQSECYKKKSRTLCGCSRRKFLGNIPEKIRMWKLIIKDTYHSSSLWLMKNSLSCCLLNSNLYWEYFLTASSSEMVSSHCSIKALNDIIGGWVGPISSPPLQIVVCNTKYCQSQN